MVNVLIHDATHTWPPLLVLCRGLHGPGGQCSLELQVPRNDIEVIRREWLIVVAVRIVEVDVDEASGQTLLQYPDHPLD